MSQHYTKESAKAARERQLFDRFAAVADLSVDKGSVESMQPPSPDLRFKVHSRVWFAELVEVVDPELARRRAVQMASRKTVSVGAFNQESPLHRAILNKAERRYQVEGPLILVVYYERQAPPPEEWFVVARTIENIAIEMVTSRRWTSVWVYDDLAQRILWSTPS